VRRDGDDRRGAGPEDTRFGEAAGGGAHASRLRFGAVPRLPGRRRGHVMQEKLPAIGARRARLPVRQEHIVVGEGFVRCRAGDFDHFQAGRALQYAMADAWRLQDHVAGRHAFRFTAMVT
jgi:hypothetical protein